jgi:hypothetical protein
MTEHDFKVGDIVEIVDWGMNDGKEPLARDDERGYDGKRGPITKIVGEDTIFVDIGVPGFFFRDLICLPNELKKVEN